jgi:2,5-diketo-D-gluconate reductase B
MVKNVAPEGASNVIPLLGLGTYPLMGQEAEDVVVMAIELGYRHIDTAQMYGNEAAVGKALRCSTVPRDQVFVVTKVDPGNLSAPRFHSSVARSIDDLGGPVDLLLIHWPPADSEIDAVIDRLITALEEGKTRHIGVSNYTINLMARAQERTGGRIICNQVEFHPLLDQSKLARGSALEPIAVQEIARKHGRPPSEVVLRWIVQQGVAAIPMSRKRENLLSNLKALQFSLPEEDMKALSAIGLAKGRTVSRGSMSGRWDK